MARVLSGSGSVVVHDWSIFGTVRHLSFGGSRLAQTLLLLPAVLMLVSCAARPANPVATSQPTDTQLSCEGIDRELAANETEARRLVDLDSTVVTGNVLSVMFFPYALDLSQKEQIEFRALYDRNRNLERLKRQKKCPEDTIGSSG
jgi:hypothetical protein